METLLCFDKIYLFLVVFLAVCVLVVGAIMVDLWDGIRTAKLTDQRIHSHKLRVTIDKMCQYWRFLVIAFLMDCIGFILGCGLPLLDFYELPLLSAVFGIGLIVTEVKSMFEHAKRRKSHLAQLPDVIEMIVNCAHDKDARKVIELVKSFGETEH